MHGRIKAALGGAAGVAVIALALAGCTAGGTGGGGETTAPPVAAGVTYMDTATGECAAPPIEGADLADAQETLAGFSTPPETLLTDAKLPEPIAPDTLVIYLDNGSPFSALISQNIGEAVAAVGAQYQSVNTGADAQSIGTAMDSVVALDPDVVITFATDLTYWQDQYEALKAGGTAIVYAGNGNADDFGENEGFGTDSASVVNATVLGAMAVAYTCGTATEFVYYAAPEIVASVDMFNTLKPYIEEHIPGATVRSVDISIMDAQAADKIVSDLQAHPETQFCIPTADQFQIGLAEKAKLTGIENAYCAGALGLAQNYQQIADDTQVADFGYSVPIQSWQAVDEGFRKLEGVFEDYDVFELIRLVGGVFDKSNIDRVDLETGAFETVPDFQDKYLALWNAG